MRPHKANKRKVFCVTVERLICQQAIIYVMANSKDGAVEVAVRTMQHCADEYDWEEANGKPIYSVPTRNDAPDAIEWARAVTLVLPEVVS